MSDTTEPNNELECIAFSLALQQTFSSAPIIHAMNTNLLTYYNKSLLNLLEKIKQLQTKPFSKPHLCFEIQAQLVKRIKYIEKKLGIGKK